MGKRWLVAALTCLTVVSVLTAPSQVAVAALAPVQVSVGFSHACALAPSGQAYCWGNNADGELGDGTSTTRPTPTPVSQGALVFSSISAGTNRTCALTSSGAAYCWGENGLGELGNNTTTSSFTPVLVVSAPAFISMALGNSHACALTSAGQAYCWGANSNGQIGDNTTSGRLTATAVQQPGGVTFASLAVGANHTCALTAAGQAYCWGLNNVGQVGDNSQTDRHTPIAVQQGGQTYVGLTAGDSTDCGLTSGGQAYCWGNNGNGEAGDGTQLNDRLTPVSVTQGGQLYVSVAAGISIPVG